MKENNLHFFFETSAKNGENVDKAFTEASKMIFMKFLADSSKNSPK